MYILDNETKQEIKKFLEEILPELQNELKALPVYNPYDDDSNFIQLTIATNNHGNEWTYQTGDNSYMGDCYFYPHWAVVYITEESEVDEILHDVIDQLEDLLNQ